MARSFVGTAGWAIPADIRSQFPEEGSALERYAARFGGVEINSSFHRRHRAATWVRWADSVPPGFRFSVKVPKTMTHGARLVDCQPLIEEFAQDVAPLAEKLGVILVQLPPSLVFDAARDQLFFAQLADAIPAPIACEPRHGDWFTSGADNFLAERRIARVAADPAKFRGAERPGGWRRLAYWRLHGSPVVYRSAYSPDQLAGYAADIKAAMADGKDCWCVFDNTASSAAGGNALALSTLINKG